MSLRLSELDPLYRSVSREEAVAIANLGAQCYTAVKDRLYASWSSSATEEETERAAVWRKEGGATMLESLRAQLAAGEAAQARVAQLQSGLEAEVLRRVEEAVTLQKKEMELAKREEMLALEKQLIELRSAAKGAIAVEEYNAVLKEKLGRMTEELESLKASTTKSSHALGKIGEATVLEMLQKYVLPKFIYSEVHDMTKVKHAGDFHLVVPGPTTKRVKIMIDSKKYSAAVDNVEIEKLYCDMDGKEEIDAGLLISLDSGISGKVPFQITKTKGGKPCLFLSFDRIDDGMRQEILCWAVRVLATVVSEKDMANRDIMVEEIQKFLAGMKRSADTLDGCVKTLKGLHATLQGLKEDMLAQIHAYRVTCGMSIVEEPVIVNPDTICKGKIRSGGQCKARRMPSSLYCARHVAMFEKKEAPIVLEEGTDTISHAE
jgi:hypothetical protein